MAGCSRRPTAAAPGSGGRRAGLRPSRARRSAPRRGRSLRSLLGLTSFVGRAYPDERSKARVPTSAKARVRRGRSPSPTSAAGASLTGCKKFQPARSKGKGPLTALIPRSGSHVCTHVSRLSRHSRWRAADAARGPASPAGRTQVVDEAPLPEAGEQDLDDDPRRPVGAGDHGLQLRHRARPRRAQPATGARHRQPAVHGHRRHRQSGHRALSIAHRPRARPGAGAELRVRPARTRQAAAQVRRPRGHADAHAPGRRLDPPGRSEGDAAQLQRRAGVEDRQRDRHRHRRRPHPLPGTAQHALFAADADLDGRQRRRGEPPGGGVIPGRQAGVERRLRADRRPRRQGGGSQRLGHAHQRQRHGVPQREAAAGGRRPQPRAPAARQDGDGDAGAPRRGRAGRQHGARSRSPTITSTRWGERRRSTTTRPSR